MSKKSNKKKFSPLQIFYLSSLVVLILIIGGTYGYVSIIQMEKSSFSLYEATLDLRVNKNIKEKSVTETLTYTLPSSWTDDVKVPYPKGETLILGSKDFKFPENGDDGEGVTMSFNTYPRYMFMTLNELKRVYEKQANDDQERIEINGIPGLKQEYPAGRFYTFIKGDYIINIQVSSYSNAYMEGRYTDDINSIINSIKFK